MLNLPTSQNERKTVCRSTTFNGSRCTNEEAVTQCMIDFKKGPKQLLSEEWALPIVMMAPKEYMEGGCGPHSESH